MPSTLTISTGYVTALLFVFNSALLSQIDVSCSPLQLKHVLLLRHSDALCWPPVQLKQSFFLASIILRSSILLTDSYSLGLCPAFPQYIQTQVFWLDSRFLDSCSFIWNTFSRFYFSCFSELCIVLRKVHSCYLSSNLTRSTLIAVNLLRVSLTYPLISLSLCIVSRACTLTNNFS